ncbi:MAG: glycine cleavage T C-terminal barrel domain-containing protein [Acidimicrobiales bacterium]
MATVLDLDATYAAIHDDKVGYEEPVDAVRVVGPEALSFLQGQVSQDLAPLETLGALETLVLSPQGKLDGHAWVVRLAEDEAVLISALGFGEGLYDRLSRFKVRVKADLSLEAWERAVLRGPKAAGEQVPEDAVRVPIDYPGYVGVDLVGLEIALPDDVPIGTDEGFEAARIEAGIPRMGAELTEKTIPQEAGIVERTVNFDKGCYTGQELVARIDARGGRVPRRLVGLVVDGPTPQRGDTLRFGGSDVGRVTSAAYSPRVHAPVALAYLKRDIEVPSALEVVTEDGVLPAEASALPLYRE